MNTTLRRSLVTSASAVLLVSGFTAVAQAHEGSDHGGAQRHDDQFHGFAPSIVHGEAVVKGKDGTLSTESLQRGTASAVSSSGLTVTSSDGFTRTYATSSTTKGSTSSGKTVVVVAKKGSSGWTAQFIEPVRH